jgi:aspartate/methionine/tyrosine aminotransferase
MRIAQRISRLGTETAFAVSAEAAAFAARGQKVYPFHLGDMNVPTPPNIVEAATKALRDGKTGYAPCGGVGALREALAGDINRSHGTSYTAANVAVQPGGKPVVGKFLMALMNPGDEVLYPSPGYPIYESQIEFQGGTGLPYGYTGAADGFRIDLGSIERQITPRTKLLVLNDPQNPTGATCSRGELAALADLALKHDLYVLADEAYFEVRYGGEAVSIASLPWMQERCVILYTFSKKYAMTGWRLGAAIGPAEIIDVIAKLNVNDESCSNHFVQYGAVEALTGDQSHAGRILATLRERRDLAVDMLESVPGVRCWRPEGTFYLFPDVTEAMRRKGLTDTALGGTSYEAIRCGILEQTGVAVCTRLHFGRLRAGEDRLYLRLAYSGIGVEDIREGLGRLREFLE